MSVDTDPGHERVEQFPGMDLHFNREGLAVKAVITRRYRSPRDWWTGYRASLMTRSALSDTLTELGRLRLTLELLAVTVVIGIGWTAYVLAVLALAGGLLGLFF